jgi:hypothetical protein
MQEEGLGGREVDE